MRCRKRRALLLDRNYAPVRIVSWKRAMKMVFGRNCAEVIEMYSDAPTQFDVSILRLVNRVVPTGPRGARVKFYRRQVLIRDGFCCVYCGLDRRDDLTIDHVLPKSRGGPTSYINCVSACRKCNQSKGDKTPEEAGMRMSKRPLPPVRGIVINTAEAPESWLYFLRG